MTRILLFSKQTLLARGVESLLQQEPAMQIVGWATSLADALDRIRDHRPDVVIVDCAGSCADSAPAIVRILQERAGIRVVGLSPQDNRISLFFGQERDVEKPADLIEALRCGSEQTYQDESA